MAVLCMIVGNVGSGKTTLTKRLYYDNFVTLGKKTFIINDDDLTMMLNMGQYECSYFTPDYWEVYNIAREGLVESLMRTRHDIILDGWLPSKKLRKPFLEIAKEHDYEVVIYAYSGPDNLTNRLGNNRGQDDYKWKSVHELFKKSYEAPSSDEAEIRYFDHKEGF